MVVACFSLCLHFNWTDSSFAGEILLQRQYFGSKSFSGSRSSPQQSIMTKCVPSEHLGKVGKIWLSWILYYRDIFGAYFLTNHDSAFQIFSIFGAVSTLLGMAMSYLNTMVGMLEWEVKCSSVQMFQISSSTNVLNVQMFYIPSCTHVQKFQIPSCTMFKSFKFPEVQCSKVSNSQLYKFSKVSNSQ